jgi:anti-sigma-K factor RskA
MSNSQSIPNGDPPEATTPAGQPSQSPCPDVEELIPAYSIGATDADENAFVRARLAECPDATHTLGDYSALSDALLYSAPPVEPPPTLAATLLQRLQTETTAQPLAPPVRPPSVRAQPRFRWIAVWAGAAAAAILLLAALNLYWLQQNLQLRHQVDQLLARQHAQELVDNGLSILLASQTRQEIELPAAQENSPAIAEVLWAPEVNMAMLYARSFPPLPPNQVYQLWLNTGGVRSSGGLFTVDQNGTGVLLFPISQPLDSLDSMGVTPEPEGGSPGPTAPAVVRRQFAS